jgi:hypothetical protein
MGFSFVAQAKRLSRLATSLQAFFADFLNLLKRIAVRMC